MEHFKFIGNIFALADGKSVEKLVNERNPSFILSVEDKVNKNNCNSMIDQFRQFINHTYNKSFDDFLVTQMTMDGDNISGLVVQLQHTHNL